MYLAGNYCYRINALAPPGAGYPVTILAILASAPGTSFSLLGITDMLGESSPYLLGLL
jgi:hypothetical protein